MSEGCVSCDLELNVDIMGIGVRAALYAQIILAWLMSLKWPETFVKNSRAAYMTATALLVASLIQWKTQGLSVLDALVVSLMTSMMTIFIVVSGTSREEAKPTTTRSEKANSRNGTSPAQANTPPDNTQPSNTSASPPAQPTSSPATIPQAADPAPPSAQQQSAEQQAAALASDTAGPIYKPRRSNTQWFIRFCFINLWGGWCFNLWSDPVHFGLEGPKVNCTTNNDVIIWVFGVELQAVSSGIRIAALVLISLLYFVAICSSFFTLEEIVGPAMRLFGFISGFFTNTSLKEANVAPRATSNKSLHEDPVINKIHYLLHFSAFGTLLYLLVSTEMTVRTNDKKGETMQWSYGQVIALILLLQQFMDVCSTFIDARENREKRKAQEEREKLRNGLLPINTQQQPEDISMKDLTPTTPSPELSV